MNKYLRILLYTVCILAIAFIVDFAIGTCVEKFLIPKQENKYMYAYNGGGGEEIAIFGASRASHHYVPQIFEDSLGIRCFNYGCSGQNIYNQYAMLNLLLNHTEKKPKLVILELASIDVLNTPTWNTEKLSVLHPYYSLDDTIKSIVELQGKNTTLALNISKFYAYNSYIHNFIKPVVGITDETVQNKGYIPLHTQWKKPIEISKVENKDVDSTKIEYIRRFINKCKSDSIDVLLLNSPHFVKFHDKRQWTEIVSHIAQKYNVPFIDYEQDDLYFEHPEWFNEPFHLNDTGAIFYTNSILASKKISIN